MATRSKVQRIDAKTKSGMIHAVFPKELRAETVNAQDILSFQHHLTQELLLLTTQICASHAVGAEEAMRTHGLLPGTVTPYGTASQLRLTAAKAGFEYVSACECVAAGCSSRDCALGKRNHPAVLDCTTNILFAWQDLAHVPSREWPKYASGVYLEPYLPMLRVSYGPSDTDVRDIEAHVVKVKRKKYKQHYSAEDTRRTHGGCDHCHMPDQEGVPHKKCSRCNKASYCSRECQVAAWREGHKQVCGK